MDLPGLIRDPATYMAHGFCLLWDPLLIWLHVASDVVTALSYYSIPIALFVFVARRRDLVYPWMFGLFAAFIFACGTTHVMGAWTLWHPDYLAQGWVKAATAVVSALTALTLWPLIPKALALPSPAQLRAVNLALSAEIEERLRAEREVRTVNAELERRVAERTAELALANERLTEANEHLEARVADRTAALEATNRALKESEARYSSMVQNAADPIFVVDVEEEPTGFIYRAVNPAFDRDTGLKAVDVVGRRPEEVIRPGYVSDIVGRYSECVRRRTVLQYEETVRRPSGERVWQTRLTPVADPETGRIVQLVGTSRDLTDYRALQEELAQASKLATLGTMAAGVAHEISQPLNAIRIIATDCQLLLEETEGAPNNADLAYILQGLTTVAEQSARLGGVVDQMRGFARRADAEAGPFDPADPVRRALALLGRQFDSDGIRLDVQLGNDLPRVSGQSVKLEQVVLNLLNNARDAVLDRRRRDGPDKAGDDGDGRVTLTLSGDEGRAGVVLTVEDDGVGLTEETAARIFDPFFTTKDGEKGMGLGLSICLGIVGAMGGTISARPLPGRGAGFTVTLPARPLAVEAP